MTKKGSSFKPAVIVVICLAVLVLLVVWMLNQQNRTKLIKTEEVEKAEVAGEEMSGMTVPERQEKISAGAQEQEKIPSPAYPEGYLLVADFNSGLKPNNIGGDFGAWNKDPADLSQGCIDSFVSAIKLGDKGYSLQLMYDVKSPNPAYNGFWMKLNGLDISGYSKLSFWIKGDELRGFTRVLKVELKNKQRQVGKYYLTDITKKWRNIVIPLEKFSSIGDFSFMDEFVLVFEDRIATKKEGAVYLDDVTFLK